MLVPNSELGHLEIDGHDAESRAASCVRRTKDLTYPEWAERLTIYYRTLEKLFCPDLIVVGGGISKDVGRVPAPDRHRDRDRAGPLENKAGIVGAALCAAEAGDEH